uniref:Uncharacterized protein n=1 Tax=Rhizophora mucronata TaxID=61149 RepID=A0A2P2PTT4_RHIMU
MLKDSRCERFANSLGKLPERLLKDKSTYWRLVKLAMASGTGPIRLF